MGFNIYRFERYEDGGWSTWEAVGELTAPSVEVEDFVANVYQVGNIKEISWSYGQVPVSFKENVIPLACNFPTEMFNALWIRWSTLPNCLAPDRLVAEHDDTAATTSALVSWWIPSSRWSGLVSRIPYCMIGWFSLGIFLYTLAL